MWGKVFALVERGASNFSVESTLLLGCVPHFDKGVLVAVDGGCGLNHIQVSPPLLGTSHRGVAALPFEPVYLPILLGESA